MNLFQVDAFTNSVFSGNPAAVVPLESWPSDAILQNIAQENNLAETAFFVPSKEPGADFDLRWFTPKIEVPLCGHATLASAHVLFTELGFKGTALRFSTQNSGLLTVTPVASSSYTMQLPVFEQQVGNDAEDWGRKLGLTVLETYDGPYKMLVLPNAAAVAGYQPDFSKIRSLNHELIITAAGGDVGPYAEFDFVSRMFAPTAGIDEDPVTGSAHCQLTPYWTLVLQKQELSAGQIGPRGGTLSVELQATQVLITGEARTYLSGQIYLQNIDLSA